jgi:oxygen-independent coproporphyrinogen-3 oxidase
MQCFDVLICETAKANFIHYEISNFGKEGFFSKHNSNYWKGIHYLGVGPSAHSYNGNSRKWNISNNNQYIRLINNGQSFSNSEELSKVDEYNEYVLTRLRTIWGVEKTMIDSQFGKSYLSHFETEIQKYLISGDCEFDDNIYFLTNKGKAIPKLICIDKATGSVFADWGPRPQGAVNLIKEYKEQFGTIDETTKADLQLWYLHDKGISTQNEIMELI